MPKYVKKPVYSFMCAMTVFITLTGCVLHAGNASAHDDTSKTKRYSSVNKSITIEDHSHTKNISNVNGRITLGDFINAKKISNVNGRIVLGSQVSSDAISSVNGGIVSKDQLEVDGSVSTVNGDIHIEDNSKVEGNIETVNGDIELIGVNLMRNIELVNGDIHLTKGTKIHGDIIYKWDKKNRSKYRSSPKLVIEKGVVINGNIILQRPVELDFENDELHDKVVTEY
ncbi:polymer-forming cytoskeletal protein [Alteromonas sp. 5E99-2]|uniref:polymer-forming cytoskeletal protein n=1 Tax=Alteromonas sp. 5E99-2 TaxID=2817683 RepID=UPI001A985BF2|nr:polymer-forming cytoskeletal protein [Alteromonas sp. 5E99-2]MBO1254410.1 polymer-forming cytoskeletal protein [Alteromonas sp. 5E99-2]